MVLGVEDLVCDAALGKGGGQLLGAFDGDGAHQDRLALGVTTLNVVGDGVVLSLNGAANTRAHGPCSTTSPCRSTIT